MRRRLLAALAAVPVAVLAMATPASASADGIIFSVDPVQPGATTSVSGTYSATGWVGGVIRLSAFVPNPSDATFTVPPAQAGLTDCDVSEDFFRVTCSWTPTLATDTITVPWPLEISGVAEPGVLTVSIAANIAAVNTTQTSDLTIEAASVSPSATASVSASPTASDPQVPTAVPAGEGPADASSSLPLLAVLGAAAVAGVGAVAVASRRAGRHQG